MEAAEESQSAGLEREGAWGATRAGNARFVIAAAAALAAGLALRVWMVKRLFEVNGDSLIYGGLAKNLLQHGQFAFSAAGGAMVPTLIRLPGYPLFLALCFKLFGMENYFAAACVQVALDLASCLLLADFARRVAPDECKHGAALATLWLAAFCPFTASYAAFPLTETPTIFMLAVAMATMARFRERPGWGNALGFTFAVTGAALLRPDGALAAVAFAPALFVGFGRDQRKNGIPLRKLVRMAVVCVLLALAPFGAWAARNWRVFHVFQPLAPRLANDPGEATYPGWEHWVKSWCLDFVSTYEIYWNVPGDKLDAGKLPSRAFDTPQQYAETVALDRAYESNGEDLSREIDAGFGRLAAERIAAQPLRYYVWLPVGRVADMWLRPRVENLPIDLDWWVYSHHHRETEFSWAYFALDAIYLGLAIAGLFLRPRFSTPRTKTCPWGPRLWGALLAYMLLRSALLLTVEAPEARYTLECFPMLFVLGGMWLAWAARRVYLAPLSSKA
jgi:Dolichyl-phosphate-mannose-protein mannosyltransferase